MAEDIKKTEETKSPENFLVNEAEVHVMPKKFVIKNPKKKDSGAKGIVVFFIIFFVILLAGLGTGYYFIQTKNKPKTEKTNTNQNTTPPSTENTNTSTSTNVNINTNTTSTNEVTNENTTSTTTNTNTATSTNTNTNIPIITVDTDQDSLTDLEEQTYQTDAKNVDSDKDGYKDGDEVKNLYNPLASIQKLIDSGLVIRYNNDLFRYEIFSPKAWLVKAIDDSRQKIELIPDNSTAELVRIEVQPNTTKKSLTDWQKSIYGSELMENFKLGNKSALRSSDKKKVLVVTDDYAYTITYEVSGGGANFETTFAMMLASFAFINPAP